MLGLASVDISTGEFSVMAVDPSLLPSEMARLEPSEIIVADTPGPAGPIAAELARAGAALTPLPPSHFDSAAGEARLTAPMVAFNHNRAQILAPHQAVDPWTGLDRSGDAGTNASPDT